MIPADAPLPESQWNATAEEVLADLLSALAKRGVAAERVTYTPRRRVKWHGNAVSSEAGAAVRVAARGFKKQTSRDNDAILGALPSLGWTRTSSHSRGGEYLHLLGYRLAAYPDSYAEYCGVNLLVTLREEE